MTNKDDLAVTTANALMLMDEAKARIDAFVATLTDAQKEATGNALVWTVRDHLKHLAVWHKSLLAIFSGQNRWEAMELNPNWIKRGVTSFDDINAMIYYHHKHLGYADSVQLFEDTFNQVREAISRLSDEDLQKPFNHFMPTESHRTDPIIGWINGITFEHYDEHLPWMQESAQLAVVGKPALNHLAIAVENIEQSVAFWRDALGLPMGEIQEVPTEAVRVAFFKSGESHVELVQPTTEDSGIAKHIAKKGTGLHHVCFEVDDIVETMARLRDKGIELINAEPKERDGRKYAFVHPKSTGGVLVELYQR